MGENLALPERDALRTPMQWEPGKHGGFSTAAPDDMVRPVTTAGTYGTGRVNVVDQQRDHQSLLRWFEQLIRVVRECPEIGVGTCEVVDVELPRHVLAHRFEAPEGSILLLHNFADKAVTVDIGRLDDSGRLDDTGSAAKRGDRPREVFADGPYPAPGRRLTGLELNGYGYRWIRLSRGMPR